MSSKIEAIKVLHNAFLNDPKYRKDWMDYIEIVVTEEMEELGISDKKIIAVRKRIAQSIIHLLDPDWWEAQSK